MNDEELQRLFDATPPVSIKLGWIRVLVLDKDGFTLKTPITRRYDWKNYYLWTDVSEFIVQYNREGRPVTLILFNAKKHGIFSQINRVFSGYSESITFICKRESKTASRAEKLAQVLNHWRIKALGQSGKYQTSQQ